MTSSRIVKTPNLPKSVGLVRPVPHDVKKAVAYMRKSLDRASMAGLVAHCGVAQRTLHKHFRKFMSASPLDYWRRLRLAAAREQLLNGANATSVTEIATRFGFHHFGRFSQQYRRCFGEVPSATVSRSRVAKHTQITRVHRRAADGAGAICLRLSREKPSLAVLPFQPSSAEATRRCFADFMADGIATALTPIRSLSVMVPKSLGRPAPPDPLRVARELGARYCLMGSLAQSDDCIRAVVRLLDSTSGVHVWGDTYDGTTGDLFGLQDRVTEGIMRAILPAIRGSEIERARRKRPEDLDAYDLMMRAYPFVFAAYPRAANRALDLLSRAMEVEPDYAPAIALAAWCHAQLVMHNGTDSPNQEQTHALLLGERAGMLDPDDPLVLTARCAVHTMAGQVDKARALIFRALALDPTSVWAWERSGWLNAFTGGPETAIKDFDTATRLDPRPPNANRMIGMGCAYFDTGRYEEAAFWKRRALHEEPGTEWINRTLSVSYARLGERLAALDSLTALHRYSPHLTIGRIVASIPFRQDFLDRVAEGLDDLGLPC
jgi:adenylate cyclase